MLHTHSHTQKTRSNSISLSEKTATSAKYENGSDGGKGGEGRVGLCCSCCLSRKWISLDGDYVAAIQPSCIAGKSFVKHFRYFKFNIAQQQQQQYCIYRNAHLPLASCLMLLSFPCSLHCQSPCRACRLTKMPNTNTKRNTAWHQSGDGDG